MTILYPRLSAHEGRTLLARYQSMDIEKIRSLAGAHRGGAIASTGGVPASPQRLQELAKEVRTCAEMYGYPNPASDRSRIHFDRSTAVVLHKTMDIVPAEAAEPDVWTYLAVCLLPDVVFWRFGTDNSERWLGRGLVRHAFARLWWQAHALCVSVDGIPDYTLVNRLNESDLNQIFERRSIGGVPPLARAVARQILDPRIDRLSIPRRDVVRDMTKRIRRLLPFTSVLAIPEEDLEARIRAVLDESIAGLSAVGSNG